MGIPVARSTDFHGQKGASFNGKHNLLYSMQAPDSVHLAKASTKSLQGPEG